MNPSVTMQILRELAKEGTIDYQDGNVGCTFARFKEAVGEVSDKCKIVIVQVECGRYSVTKSYQKTLKKIAAYNIDRDSLYVEPHPRWGQLSMTDAQRRASVRASFSELKEEGAPYDYTRFALFAIGSLLVVYGSVSFYYSIINNF